MKLPWQTDKQLRGRVQELETRLVRVQESVLEGLKYTTETSVSKFSSRAEIVKAISDRFENRVEYGCELVQRIVNFRAGIITAGGMKPEKKRDLQADEELNFLQGFVDDSDLGDFMNQQLGVEKEIEGQVLLSLYWDPARVWFDQDGKEQEGMVRLRYYPWSAFNYEIEFDKNFTPVRATWAMPESGQPEKLDASEFVFLKFNSRLNSKYGRPALSGNIKNCDDLSKALKDWREINRLFAAPTPYFKLDPSKFASLGNAQTAAKELSDQLVAVNWKIGKVFVSIADFSMIGPDIAGVQSIKQEIETKAKILSGGVDVPLQFLGFPEFMSNRATAENTMEPLGIFSSREQAVWTSGFQELFDKAIEVYNRATGKSLRQRVIVPKIAFVTQSQIDRIQTLYLELWKANGMTLKTLLGMVPDMPDDEWENVKADETAKAAVRQEQVNKLLSQTPPAPGQEDNQPPQLQKGNGKDVDAGKGAVQ